MFRTFEEVRDYIDERYEEVIIFSGVTHYASAFVGVVEDGDTVRAVYSYSKMIEWLMEECKMSYEDAVEWIDFNTIPACYRINDPLVLFDEDLF